MVMAFAFAGVTNFSVGSIAAERQALRSVGCPTEYFLIQDLADAYKLKTGRTVLAGSKNSSSGLMFLSKGKVDFAFSCRPVETMKGKPGFDPLVVDQWAVLPLAVEPIVFVVHRDLAVDSLTLDQIRGIFFGDIKNWQTVKGPDFEVKPVSYGLDELSGMEIILREIVLRPSRTDWQILPFSSTTKVQVSEPNMLGYYVNKHPGSIGYFGFAHLKHGYRQELGKVLKVNGVAPTRENIVNGSYPFVARYRLVYYKDKLDYRLQKFLEFVQSEEGKVVINKKFVAVDGTFVPN